MNKTIFVAALVGIILISAFGALSWVGNHIDPVQRELLVGGGNATSGIRNFIVHFRSVSDLQRDYNRIHEENGMLIAQNAELELLAQENEELKRLSNFASTKKQRIVSGRIYGYQSIDQHKGFFDAGKESGVESGQWVVGSDGNVIGVIGEVRDRSSEVTFISSPELSLQIVLGTGSEVVGVTQGGNRAEVMVGLIPKQVLIQKGSYAYSAVEGTRSRELLIGAFTSVSSAPSDLFQTAVVELHAPLSKVNYGGVLIHER